MFPPLNKGMYSNTNVINSRQRPFFPAETPLFLFQIFLLRRLMQGDEKHPKTILANNYRPPQPLYNRSVRTNVFNHDIGVSNDDF